VERIIDHTHKVWPVIKDLLLLRGSNIDIKNGYDFMLMEYDEIFTS